MEDTSQHKAITQGQQSQDNSLPTVLTFSIIPSCKKIGHDHQDPCFIRQSRNSSNLVLLFLNHISPSVQPEMKLGVIEHVTALHVVKNHFLRPIILIYFHYSFIITFIITFINALVFEIYSFICKGRYSYLCPCHIRSSYPIHYKQPTPCLLYSPSLLTHHLLTLYPLFDLLDQVCLLPTGI